MKKVLLASTALVMSAGFAAADVSVGGDGRMGIIGGGTDDTATATVDETDLAFTSRIRISFAASGETDAGLAFGGSVRVDNYEDDQATNGTEGSVFVEGTFGKISMGDVSGAPEAAVGDLSGVGLTGLGDYNELTYLSNGERPAARWDYVTGDLGLHVSADNPGAADDTYGVAVTYSTGGISLGLGYEDSDALDTGHIVAGVTAALGDATVKLVYGDADDIGFTQYGASVDFVTGATTVTAFWRTADVDGVADGDAYGIGVSYDLGGGAAIKAGYVDGDDISDPLDAAFATELEDGRYDFGISMSF
ncbi:MAG: porin [Pseudomonadota bacterium]